MPYRFPLEVVLQYRAELEQREERALGAHRERVNQLRTQLAHLKMLREQARQKHEEALLAGVLGSDLHYAEMQSRSLAQAEAALRKELSSAITSLDKQMKVYLAARQKREILAELKKTSKQRYQVEADRKAQSAVDELFSARFQREK